MSTFAVTVEQVESVLPHPDPETHSLQLVSLKGLGYQFITKKGSVKQDDLVVYFPVDSLVPEEVLAKIGMVGKLSGKSKNRVKTMKFRGCISQGLSIPAHELVPESPSVHQDVTSLLGVTKYEPPVVYEKSGIALHELPNLVSHYDIESAQRYTNILEILMDEEVVITEKLEGMHWWCMMTVEANNLSFRIGSHHKEIVLGENQDLPTAYKVLSKEIQEIMLHHANVYGARNIVARGELIGPGIQKNIYGLKDHEVQLFDLELDGKVLSWNLLDRIQVKNWVPIVAAAAPGMTLRKMLNGNNLIEQSNGLSVLNKEVLREGIVVRPVHEKTIKDFGRLILKVRSPAYLASSDL